MATANPFANVGLSQFGQDANFSSGSKDGIGNFILGAALSSLGVPPSISKGLTGEKTPVGSSPAVPPVATSPLATSTEPVVPVVNNSVPEQDARTQFSLGFKSLFSHLPQFGVK